MTNKGCNPSAMPQKNLRSILSMGAKIALVTAPILAAPIVWAGSSNVIFTGDFEKGNTSGWHTEICCKHSVQVVKSPVRSGKYAAKFTLNKNDPDTSKSRRAELKVGSTPANSERWYGFSFFIPNEFAKDKSQEAIIQWLGSPDKGEGYTGRGPAFSVRIENDNYILDNRWDSRAISTKNVNKQEWNVGKVPKGKWTDWVVHVKWSYKSDGLLEVWKDGQLVLKKNGPNSFNDKTGPVWKMGVYKWDWKYSPKNSSTTQRVLYLDEVRMGDAGASYTDVAPRGTLIK